MLLVSHDSIELRRKSCLSVDALRIVGAQPVAANPPPSGIVPVVAVSGDTMTGFSPDSRENASSFSELLRKLSR